jgi:hypothetical protein
MMIPDGGGLAAAAVMHHRVYDLTVEFHDSRGAYHAAVFVLPGSDATRVLNSYTKSVSPAKRRSARRKPSGAGCADLQRERGFIAHCPRRGTNLGSVRCARGVPRSGLRTHRRPHAACRGSRTRLSRGRA